MGNITDDPVCDQLDELALLPPFFDFHVLHAIARKPATYDELSKHLGWHPVALERALADLTECGILNDGEQGADEDRSAGEVYSLNVGGMLDVLEHLWSCSGSTRYEVTWTCAIC